MASALLRERLPPGCHIGVTQDGRVFFINDQNRTTSWLHPTTGEPVLTGLQGSGNEDLPRGWEQDSTVDGYIYYIDHNSGMTSFIHPQHQEQFSQEYSPPPSPTQGHHHHDARSPQPPQSPGSPQSPTSPNSTLQRDNFKRGTFKQRSVKAPTAKRNPNSAVVKSGWLHKLEGGGLSKSKSWKKRWAVLADFALFLYKGEEESTAISSILLPGYKINPCTQEDNIKRNFVFKVEHENTKTVYFATDDSPELVLWMSLLRQASLMNGQAGFQRETNNNVRHYPPKDSNGKQNSPSSARDSNSLFPDSLGYGDNYSSSPNPSLQNLQNLRPYNQDEYPPAGSRDRPQFSGDGESPSYQGYNTDPTASPVDANPPRIGGVYPFIHQHHPQRHSYVSQSSTANNRDSYAVPHHNREHNSLPGQPPQHQHVAGRENYPPSPYQPRWQDNLEDRFRQNDPRENIPGGYGQMSYSQQKPLRDGFAPDSVRSSMAAPDQRNSYIGSQVDQAGPLEQRAPRPLSDSMNQSRGYEDYEQKSFDRRSHASQQYNPQNYDPSSHSHGQAGADSSSFHNQSQDSNSFGRNPQPMYPNQTSTLQSQPPSRENADIRNRLSQSSHDSRARFSSHQDPNSHRNFDPPPQGHDRRSQASSISAQQFHNTQHVPLSQYNPEVSFSNSNPNYSFHNDLNTSQHNRSLNQYEDDSRQQQKNPQFPGSTSNHSHLNQSYQPSHNDSYPPASFSQPGNHQNLHTYVNFPSHQNQPLALDTSRDSSMDQAAPKRPPYPAEMRNQIVEEIAKVQTPSTQKDFLISAQFNEQRMQQPPFFQYPSPRDSYDGKVDSKQLSNSQKPRDTPNSRMSTASRASQASRADNSMQNGKTTSSRPMMDPEAQKLRMAYERVHSLRSSPDKAPPRRPAGPIQTVKEDPNMPDVDVLETDLQKVAAKNPLNGPRLRMSISAADLIGKTHDELVLLLIQLRRNQKALDQTRDFYRAQIDHTRPAEMEYRKQMHQFGSVSYEDLHHSHRTFTEAKSQMEEIENKLEVYRPIINLLDNMVTMGSLYGGDNLMLATQYRKHLLRPDQYQPPKKMLEFSRQHQEERLVQETHEDIKQLSKDEVDLEDKIDRLNEVDRLLQEQSFKVSSFKEDKELMERALIDILRQQDQSRHDPREMRRLTQQQRTMEKEISRVTQQLAEASKELEETTAENNKLEHEIALLRTKVHGELSRSRSVPSLASENLRAKMKMEKELAKVQDMMQGLNQKGAKLSQAMNTLRRSSSGTHLASTFDDVPEQQPETKSPGTFIETDLDSGEQVDHASSPQHQQAPASQAPLPINHHRQNAANEWDIDSNDEDTKKFFGLLPRDKPKGQTVRDVKRLSEARKDKEKDKFGEEIKLRVSNVDNEISSIIHARIAKDTQPISQSSVPDPLYENLPHYGSMPALAAKNNGATSNNPSSAASSRRSSIILLTPKPFVPYQDKTYRPFQSDLSLKANNNGSSRADTDKTDALGENYFNKDKSYASDRPYHSQDMLAASSSSYLQTRVPDTSQLSYNSSLHSSDNPETSEGHFHAKPMTVYPRNTSQSFESPVMAEIARQQAESFPAANEDNEKVVPQTYQSNLYAPRPWMKTGQGGGSLDPKRTSKGRYMTISSSQPLKLESGSLLNPTIHSTAGDLILNRSIDDVPDIVKSSQGKMDQIDSDVIDREILSVPDKVLISERYDAEADAEHLTEDEKFKRQARSERIRKVLASQSLISLSQPDVSTLPSEKLHSRVEEEKKERAHFLALSQELARQVTQQTKKQAAERRKTWSGAQFADAKKQYEEAMQGSPTGPLRSPDAIRKRSDLVLRSP